MKTYLLKPMVVVCLGFLPVSFILAVVIIKM